MPPGPAPVGGCVRLLALPALLGALFLLTGCDALGKAGAASHDPPAKTFTVSQRVTAVVIHGGTGSVDVTGTAGSAVSVSQQTSYSGAPPTATHVLSGTTLTMSYTCPRELLCSVSYDVRVPRGVAVTASTGAGSVTLTSLTGPVTARASAGLITGVDMRSPTASFATNAGGVIAAFDTAPRSVTATTNVGPITLSVPGSVRYQLTTHTLVGTSTVTVPRDGGSGHSISASSDLGSISISPS